MNQEVCLFNSIEQRLSVSMRKKFLTHCRIGSFRVLRQSFCGKFEFSAESGHTGYPLLECMIACFTILHMLLCWDCFQSPISHADTTFLSRDLSKVLSQTTLPLLYAVIPPDVGVATRYGSRLFNSRFPPENCHPVQRGRPSAAMEPAKMRLIPW